VNSNLKAAAKKEKIQIPLNLKPFKHEGSQLNKKNGSIHINLNVKTFSPAMSKKEIIQLGDPNINTNTNLNSNNIYNNNINTVNSYNNKTNGKNKIIQIKNNKIEDPKLIEINLTDEINFSSVDNGTNTNIYINNDNNI
jgi:hypothetical protein